MSHGQVFVLAIVAIITCASLVKMSIRAKHGYVPDDADEARPRSDLAAERRIALLSGENEKLHGQVGRLEERIAVLERIATDPAERVSRDIEALR